MRFLGFLSCSPQVNNFVVYDGFFLNKSGNFTWFVIFFYDENSNYINTRFFQTLYKCCLSIHIVIMGIVLIDVYNYNTMDLSWGVVCASYPNSSAASWWVFSQTVHAWSYSNSVRYLSYFLYIWLAISFCFTHKTRHIQVKRKSRKGSLSLSLSLSVSLSSTMRERERRREKARESFRELTCGYFGSKHSFILHQTLSGSPHSPLTDQGMYGFL